MAPTGVCPTTEYHLMEMYGSDPAMIGGTIVSGAILETWEEGREYEELRKALQTTQRSVRVEVNEAASTATLDIHLSCCALDGVIQEAREKKWIRWFSFRH